jgi:hypothetical protein
MSNAITHEIRSHRSMRSYKPVYKTIHNKDAKDRKKKHRFVRLASAGRD